LSSCKEFDGMPVNEQTMERAKACLHLALLYIDRTVDPPIFRYIEPDDRYEILGWIWKTGNKVKKNIDIEINDDLQDGIYYVVRLKDGRVLLLSEAELKHIDSLLRLDSLLKFKKSLGF